jgi:integrase
MAKPPKPPTTPNTTPVKPHPDFPLYPHRSGQWCKKIKGQAHYFGSWRRDPQGNAAFDLYRHELPYLLRDEKPPPLNSAGFKLADVVNLWVGRKKERMDAGKLSPLAYKHYHDVGRDVLRHLGEESPAEVSRSGFESLRASFEARLGAEALLNDMNSVVSMFKLASKHGIVSRLPDLDECFERPTSLQLRAAQEAAGARMFTVAEFNKMLKAADVNFRAMLMLGLNGALGNSDLSEMTLDTFRKEPGWLNYPRHKTAMRRRIPLWPETTAAVEAAIAKRQSPLDESEARLLFIHRGKSYRDGRHGIRVWYHFNRTALRAGVKGRTFYDLRRTFQTVADKCLDFVAVTAVMGHAPNRQNMPARYRQVVDDDRLLLAVNTVRNWLYGANVKSKAKGHRSK